MPFKVSSKTLISRAIRINITKGVTGVSLLSSNPLNTIGNTGIRRIDKASAITKNQANNQGFLGWLWDSAKSLVGWVFKAATGGIAWTWTGTWGTIVQTIEKIKAFNWNQTDQEIEQSIKSRNTQLAGIWGGVLGSGVGWLAGIATGAGVAYLCPVIGSGALARLIAGEVAIEAGQDLRSRLQIAINQTANVVVSNLAVGAFMRYRQLLKSLPYPVLVALYGESKAKFIRDKWGGKGQPDSSFNAQMEEEIDSISNEATKNFVEQFLEESWDSFVEAGFIVAHQIDGAYQQTKLAQQELLGQDKSIEIALDKDAPDEILTFHNVPQKLLIPAIQQSVNTHRILHNKDVGQIVGEPFETNNQRALPQTRKITLIFRESEKPPYKRSGAGKKEITINIPNVKPGLSWKDVKSVCTPYTWGKWCARARLDSRRQMAVYAATKEEAVKKLKEFASLSLDNILTINVSQEEQVPSKLAKNPTRVYPAQLAYTYLRPNGNQRTFIDGKTYSELFFKTPLWKSEPPKDKNILDVWK